MLAICTGSKKAQGVSASETSRARARHTYQLAPERVLVAFALEPAEAADVVQDVLGLAKVDLHERDGQSALCSLQRDLFQGFDED